VSQFDLLTGRQQLLEVNFAMFGIFFPVLATMINVRRQFFSEDMAVPWNSAANFQNSSAL